MPGGDGTGPAGMGPMTGRAAGYCAGYAVPGYMNPTFGRGIGGGGFWGRGGGRGGGRGRRNWYNATGMTGWQRAAQGMPAWGMYPPPAYGAYAAPAYGPYGAAPEQELEMLQRQAEGFTEQLEQIKQRIEELQKEQEGK